MEEEPIILPPSGGDAQLLRSLQAATDALRAVDQKSSAIDGKVDLTREELVALRTAYDETHRLVQYLNRVLITGNGVDPFVLRLRIAEQNIGTIGDKVDLVLAGQKAAAEKAAETKDEELKAAKETKKAAVSVQTESIRQRYGLWLAVVTSLTSIVTALIALFAKG